jgi:hypothetical protein
MVFSKIRLEIDTNLNTEDQIIVLKRFYFKNYEIIFSNLKNSLIHSSEMK